MLPAITRPVTVGATWNRCSANGNWVGAMKKTNVPANARPYRPRRRHRVLLPTRSVAALDGRAPPAETIVRPGTENTANGTIVSDTA